MTLSIAQANLKPGTGKTTGAVWLSYAFHDLGQRVLLADCDPAGSALAWNDLVDGMPFDVIGLATRDAGRRLASLAPDDAVVVVDLPQMEDHERINTSVLRYVDEVTVPITSSPIEIERMSPIRDRVEDVNDLRDHHPARLSVLLNRINRSARSGEDAREALRDDLGYDVLEPVIPRLERYSLSYGTQPAIGADEPFRALAEIYLKRAEAAA